MVDSDRTLVFREVDHTADLRVEIYGDTEEDLFRNSIRTLYSLLGLPDAIDSDDFRSGRTALTFFGMDLEDVLVRMLGEFLYLAVVEGRRLVPGNFTCGRKVRENGVELSVEGVLKKVDMESTKRKYDIKAVTYHEAKILRTAQGYVATLVMDL